MMDKYIGKRLKDRYEIEEVIGVGGMAFVYKARDIVNGYDVAIKILKEEYLQNDEFCRRFRNESKAIALLSHRNIVKVFDVSTDESCQYIVMEYIDGITLKEYIEQQGTLSWKEAVHFTTQILRALQHAHEKGIIHRDIKPQNIMLLANGEIRVMDFGIARFSRSETRTMTDKAIGSVHYIAPEQARGSKTDERADIYSVGVMLYEMLTGQLPFEAENAVSVAVMQLQADPQMPRQVNPNIPQGLEEITIQAMQKDPANRYQTATEMLLDIDEFKRNPSIRFEYQYMVDDSQSRYREAIGAARRQMIEENEQQKSPIIPVLGGIASAFVLVTVIFLWIALDINNLFNTGGEQVLLPSFVGEVYNEVVSDPEYKFQWVMEEKFDPTIPEGQIMEQKPKGGKNVYVNTTVTLIVSKGPERKMVPEYDGRDFADYSQELLDMGLVYKKYEVYSDDVEEGRIINTNPVPRTTVQDGDTIEVYVSLGVKPDNLSMPNCVNMMYDDAKERMNAMNMNVAEPVEVDSEKPKGMVIAHDPPAGTALTEGATIKFTISNGNAPTKEVKLTVQFPSDVNISLPVEFYLDGVKVKAVTINPQNLSNAEYGITLTGTNTKTMTVYINGDKYRDYLVDFTAGTYTVSKDYGFTAPTTTTTTTTTTEAVTEPTDAPVTDEGNTGEQSGEETPEVTE